MIKCDYPKCFENAVIQLRKKSFGHNHLEDFSYDFCKKHFQKIHDGYFYKIHKIMLKDNFNRKMDIGHLF